MTEGHSTTGSNHDGFKARGAAMTGRVSAMAIAALLAAPVWAQETPTEREAAKDVLVKMDALEKSLVISQTHVNDEPVYQWFALAAVLLIGAALAVNAVPFFNEMT